MHQYESDLSTLFWETLEKQFGLKDGKLYEYLVLRSLTETVRKGRVPEPDIKHLPWQLIRSILDEWKLEGRLISFMGDTFRLNTSSMHGIALDWHQRYAYLYYDGNFESDILFKWKSLLKTSKAKQSKWSKKIFFTDVLQQEYLHQINSLYHIQNLSEIHFIDGLTLIEESHPIRMEVLLERRLHPHFVFESHSEQLTEKQLEDYLYRHLSLMEEGLRPIKRQYSVENGRIDILAKDTEGKMVIIEVKVESDTDLVWQESYYVQELEKEFGKEQVRFIAVVPRYEPHIMNGLKEKPHCQIFTFNAVMKGTSLKEIQLQREGAIA